MEITDDLCLEWQKETSSKFRDPRHKERTECLKLEEIRDHGDLFMESCVCSMCTAP